MRGTRHRGAIGVGTVCLWCALAAAPAVWADAGISTHALGEAPAAVRGYWTSARMRAAKPADGLVASPLGEASAQPVVAPRAKRLGIHQRVRKTASYPHRTEGAVFFTLAGGPPNGGDYRCSGTAVRSPSRSLVWTAGHCVFDPGALGAGYATNWEFVPGHNSGRSPFGEWPASSLATTKRWQGSGPIGGGDSAFDLGAATVSPRGGRLLQERIGARRIAFGQPRNQAYSAFGYPAKPPPREFDGRHLFKCRSPYRGSDRGVGPPAAIRISCDMTAGASGGAWVVRRGRRGYVVSVTSYGYGGRPTAIYGPYQGGVARALHRAAGS
jgi:hypothetical protein